MATCVAAYNLGTTSGRFRKIPPIRRHTLEDGEYRYIRELFWKQTEMVPKLYAVNQVNIIKQPYSISKWIFD